MTDPKAGRNAETMASQFSSLGSCQLSYAAGSTSLEPDGYRVIGRGDQGRIADLMKVFPVLGDYLHDQSMIISAYPAALGIGASVPFVDTYLHSPTFIRAMRLASRHRRCVVFAAQPLAGADLLLKLIDSPFDLPPRMLWAAGGYRFPESLERFMHDRLAERGCEMKLMHCYGVAEVGHTCFAAMERDVAGEPVYQIVASDVAASIDSAEQRLVLSKGNQTIDSGDHAFRSGNQWRITNSRNRITDQVRQQIESWSAADWRQRTGYLRCEDGCFTFQLREGIVNEPARKSLGESLGLHRFWERFGGSWQSKPTWQEFRSAGHRHASITTTASTAESCGESRRRSLRKLVQHR